MKKAYQLRLDGILIDGSETDSTLCAKAKDFIQKTTREFTQNISGSKKQEVELMIVTQLRSQREASLSAAR